MFRITKCSYMNCRTKPRALTLPGIAVLSAPFCHKYLHLSPSEAGDRFQFQKQYAKKLVMELSLGLKSSFVLYLSARRRGFAVEAKDNDPEEPALHFGESNAICTIRDILSEKIWCAETERQLTYLSSSINAHVVVKVLKSVPVEVALQFFQWLKIQGFVHDFRTYHAMVDALGEARCFSKMKVLVNEMREAGCTMRAMLYRDVIYWCACAGDFAGVMSYWEDAKKDEVQPSAPLWTALIDVHAKAKRHNDAVKLFSEMLEAGLNPNPRTLSIFIDNLVDLGKLNDADLILESMKRLNMFPSMTSYASLMAAHAKAGNVVLLKNMGKHLRFVCDRPGYMFCNAIRRMFDEDKEKEGLLFGSEVWPELSPDQIIKKVAIGSIQSRDMPGFCSPSNVASENPNCTKKQILSHIHLEKILKTWNSSTISLLQQAKLNWNDDLIHELLSRRVQKPQIAWSLFCWLISVMEIQPDIFNQITMLRILSKNNMFSALSSLLMKMRQQGVKLSVITLNFVIKDFSCARNAQAASWVFNYLVASGLEPDQETFTALMDAYSHAKWHQDALLLLEKMVQAGHGLQPSSCYLLIDILRLAGRMDVAHAVFHTFLDAGGSPEVQCYSALIKAYCHSGNTEFAVQTFRQMERSGIDPIPETLQSMSWVYLQIGDLENFHKCLKSSQEAVSPEQKLQMHHKETLISIKTVLVNCFVEERAVNPSASDT